MRFVRVVASDPRCAPNCPEWISAEGQIQVGSGAEFRALLAGLHGRRLPILISSRGGSIPDAIAIGRMIRDSRLAVAVAETHFDPCDEKSADCSVAKGSADATRAICASACALVLASGVERFAHPQAAIGVHQSLSVVTQTRITRQYEVTYRIVNGRKEEASRREISEQRRQVTTRQAEAPHVESEMAGYFGEMGIGPELIAMAETATPAEVRILDKEEKRATRLVTAWIDAHAVVLSGLYGNGLDGIPAIEGEGTPVFAGGIDWPVETASDDPVLMRLTFTYRRGGGVIVAALSPRRRADPKQPASALDLRVSSYFLELSPGDIPVEIESGAGNDLLRAAIPRNTFCKLDPEGRIVLRRMPIAQIDIDNAPPPEPRPILLTRAASVYRLASLIEEACPARESGRAQQK